MHLETAVNNIASRVKKLGPETSFSYKEVNRWLDTSSGNDLMWAYDKLSDRLTIKHSVCLELRKEFMITSVPTEADITSARRRSEGDIE